MKAPKASKRLAKIEVLLSDVIDRFAPTERDTRQALQDAKAAVVHAKKAVMLQTTNGTARKVSRKMPAAKAKAAKSASAS